MPIDPAIAKVMADVLNRRGFLTHDDFSLGDDGAFGSYVCSQEPSLRIAGYSGGPLEPWSTSFRPLMAFTYGVLDTETSLKTELLDAYTLATNFQLEESELVIDDLPHLLIGLQFRCTCGQLTKVDPKTFPYKERGRRIHQASALCSSCKHEIAAPEDVYPLFKGFP